MISRDNYEIWFLDFLEGNLNAKDKKMVQTFLSKHQDLAQELEAIKNINLSGEETIEYNAKSKLKKHPLDDAIEFDNACIAFIEEQSTEEEREQLLEYTKSRPEKAAELSRFKQTIFSAENSITFPHKSSLHKKARVLLLYRVANYAAAIFIIGLFLSIYSGYRQLDRSIPVLVQHNGLYSIPKKQPVIANKVIANLEKKQTAKVAGNSPNRVIAEEKPGEEKLPFNPQKRKLTVAKVNPKLESLQPISIRFKPSVLVFMAPPLIPVEAPSENPKKPGLLASILGGKEKEKELGKAAQSLGNVKVAPSVLNLLSDISKDRLSYSENNQGDIASLSFKSKLLKFSLPLASEK